MPNMQEAEPRCGLCHAPRIPLFFGSQAGIAVTDAPRLTHPDSLHHAHNASFLCAGQRVLKHGSGCHGPCGVGHSVVHSEDACFFFCSASGVSDVTQCSPCLRSLGLGRVLEQGSHWALTVAPSLKRAPSRSYYVIVTTLQCSHFPPRGEVNNKRANSSSLHSCVARPIEPAPVLIALVGPHAACQQACPASRSAPSHATGSPLIHTLTSVNLGIVGMPALGMPQHQQPPTMLHNCRKQGSLGDPMAQGTLTG